MISRGRILCAALAALMIGVPPRVMAQVVISEFAAANTGILRDEDGHTEDWIELCNVSGDAVNMRGWSLTDERSAPSKWSLPATNLASGQFLVLFASGKDRGVAGRQLHTNFRLSVSGEYLGLYKPDGTIANDFSPAYPPQAEDITYGLQSGSREVVLLRPGDAGAYHVPINGAQQTAWFAPDFDHSSWLTSRGGIGFDLQASYPANLGATDIRNEMHGKNSTVWMRIPFAVADPDLLDSLKLRMHFNDGFLAYLNGAELLSRNAPVQAAGGLVADSTEDWGGGFQGGNNWYFGFYDREADPDHAYNPETDFVNVAPNWNWNGAAWVLGPSNPPWDMVGRESWHPNGTNSGGVHWALRRWVSEVPGNLLCRLQLAHQSGSCGNGVTVRILQGGVQAFAAVLHPGNTGGLLTNVFLSNVQAGELVDFVLDPAGLNGQEDDVCDTASFHVSIEQIPSDGPAWNSVATAPRSAGDTLRQEEFELSADFVLAGTNVLALHGLNVLPNDPDLYLIPELVGTIDGLDPAATAYFPKPTPGAPNQVGSTNIGPIIVDVQHEPAIPLDNDSITVRARVSPVFGQVSNVTLRYRVMYGAETAAAMLDDGQHGDLGANDGIFAASIPAHTSLPGQMVRWMISAVDNSGQQSRSPAHLDARRSPQYFGTVVWNPVLTNSRLPVLHWFMQNPNAADSDTTARASMFFQGEFYDNIGVDLHGQSTRGFPKKSYDIDFNPGSRFRWSDEAPRVDDINLLTTWADKTHMRNVLAHETYRDAGAASHFAFPVRVQKNNSFFSVANVVENGGERFLERVGLDPRGALYKMYNSAESVSGAEKKTRRFEGTADLQALIAGLSQSSGVARQAYVYDHLDLPAMVNFLAAKMITADTDCCHKNYYLYRDSEGTGLWQAMPWDVDLSFGRVWTCNSPCYGYYDQVIYTNQSIFVGLGNTVFSQIYGTPAVRQMFVRRLRTLMDQLLQPPGTEFANDFYKQKTLSLRHQIAPDAALDLAKWGTWGARESITQAVDRIWNEFLPGRRAYLFQRLSVTSGGELPGPQPTNVVVSLNGVEFRPASGHPLEEWLSITNANGFAVDISGWKLMGGARFTFHPGTVVPARTAMYVSPDIRAFLMRGVSPKGGERRLVVGPYSGALSSWGETLQLSDTSGRLVSTFTYTGEPSLVQRFLRVTEVFFNPNSWPGLPGTDPQAFEFIELRNIGPIPLDLRGVRFSEGIEFTFSDFHTNLAPGAYALLVKDTAAFLARFGVTTNILGTYEGSLANSGERVRLDDSFGEKIVDFTYKDEWLAGADGEGASMNVANEARNWAAWMTAPEYGDYRENWTPTRPSPGQPGPSLNVLSIIIVPGGCRLEYRGLPGRRCQVQRSEDLRSWTVLREGIVPITGVLQMVDEIPPAKGACYRVLWN